ncbi:hypothetical protein ACHHYP_17306 [Achlya hypogyna]|uniref:glucan 1,3-beta-glucosidase n=1 Tax=Achlya hypogyna TaxID=1202772 RepID=A0A1V9Y4S9_ACHHY|nr:hypothetical protein ACHHYP_17306 [Achlya hypogyna]
MRPIWLAGLLGASAHGHIQADIRAGRVPSRGVNLGGWLVAENWMTPSQKIWANVPAAKAALGEYHAMAVLGHGVGDALFDAHRRTFITQADVAQIAAAGLNTVRVPVGYWIRGCSMYSGDLLAQCSMFAPGGLQYLDALVNVWAKLFNVAVFISVHGAPGSQNGNDHSGVVDGIHWTDSTTNVQATTDLVLFLVRRYQGASAFLGVGLLNEPGEAVNEGVLFQYYKTTYAAVRKFSDCVLSVMPRTYHQFAGTGSEMGDFGRGMTNVWVEWHPYLIWGFESYSEAKLLGAGIDAIAANIKKWSGHPLFFGEWSFVTPGKTFTNAAAYAVFQHKLLSTVNAAQGWTYWTWKADGDGYGNRWSLRDLLRRMQYPVTFTAANAVGTSPSLAVLQVNGVGLTAIAQTQSLAMDTAWTDTFGPLVSERWSYNPSTQQLQSLLTGDCLDGYMEPALARYVVHGYHCDATNANQKWTISNHQLVHYGLCLSLADASVNADPTESKRMEPCNITDTAQFFTLGQEIARVRIAMLPSRVLSSKLTFDLPSQSDLTQRWLFNHVAYTVSNVGTGLCLSGNQNKAVRLATCITGNSDQRWRFNPSTSQLEHVQYDGFCLNTYNTPSLSPCRTAPDAGAWAQTLQIEWLSYPQLTSSSYT